MRVVTITKTEFDRVLYPALANGPSENEQELGLVVGIKKRLRPYITEKALTPSQALEGQYPLWELTEDQAEVAFQEDEWILLKKRVKQSIPTFTGHAAEVVFGIIDKLNKAEKRQSGVALVDEEGDAKGVGTPEDSEAVMTDQGGFQGLNPVDPA